MTSVATFARDPNPDVPAGAETDHELLIRTKALLASRQKFTFTHEELLRAAQEIMRANPHLAQEYKYLPDKKAVGA